jgi:hypothetical protein
MSHGASLIRKASIRGSMNIVSSLMTILSDQHAAVIECSREDLAEQ